MCAQTINTTDRKDAATTTPEIDQSCLAVTAFIFSLTSSSRNSAAMPLIAMRTLSLYYKRRAAQIKNRRSQLKRGFYEDEAFAIVALG